MFWSHISQFSIFFSAHSSSQRGWQRNGIRPRNGLFRRQPIATFYGNSVFYACWIIIRRMLISQKVTYNFMHTYIKLQKHIILKTSLMVLDCTFLWLCQFVWKFILMSFYCFLNFRMTTMYRSHRNPTSPLPTATVKATSLATIQIARRNQHWPVVAHLVFGPPDRT